MFFRLQISVADPDLSVLAGSRPGSVYEKRSYSGSKFVKIDFFIFSNQINK